jgi:membrane protease YdiL (CAAX protease family)
LLAILIIAIPLACRLHLNKARKIEHKERLNAINGYTRRISTGKLVLYIAVLVVFMFFILGNYSTDQYLITEKLLSWLPSWYTLQNFIRLQQTGNYCNPGAQPADQRHPGAGWLKEYYFRGYLLPRMESWGKWAFVVNAILFSFYHFWQPLFISPC